MAVLDFLFYYLTLWFSTSKTKNRIRTPPERTAYTLGIFSTIWVFFIGSVVDYLLTKSFNNPIIPTFVYVLIGLGLIQIYSYIYIKNGRYEKIVSGRKPFSQYNFSTRNAVNISLIACVLSLIIPVIIRFIMLAITGK